MKKLSKNAVLSHEVLLCVLVARENAKLLIYMNTNREKSSQKIISCINDHEVSNQMTNTTAISMA